MRRTTTTTFLIPNTIISNFQSHNTAFDPKSSYVPGLLNRSVSKSSAAAGRTGLWSVNDTFWEKLCFTQFSTRMAAWLLLTFFMFTQSIKFFAFHYHLLPLQLEGEKTSKYRCVCEKYNNHGRTHKCDFSLSDQKHPFLVNLIQIVILS